MLQRLLSSLVFGTPLMALGQLFSPPVAMMYRPALPLENPAPNTKSIITTRYIPGSRFPDSWDQKTEDRQYDSAGRLTLWRRYDGFTGSVLAEKKVTYNPQGDRIEERTFRKENNKEEILKFQNQYDGSGQFQGATITDATGKTVGAISLTKEGNRLTELATGPGGKKISMMHDPKGRMLQTSDESTQSFESYQYDPSGELIAIKKTRGGQTFQTQYKLIRDEKNRVVRQEEIVPEGKRIMVFSYDDRGNLISRRFEGMQISESYGYGPGGQIIDIMQYTPEGHPREVTGIFTESFR